MSLQDLQQTQCIIAGNETICASIFLLIDYPDGIQIAVNF
jgi:hypothetical protein